MKSAFTDLRQTHGTAEKLKRALKGMDKLTLEALILNSAFPEVCVCVCMCVCGGEWMCLTEGGRGTVDEAGYQTLCLLPPEVQRGRQPSQRVQRRALERDGANGAV